jgi:hypothetical protein
MRDLQSRGFVEMKGDSIVLRNRIALIDSEPAVTRSQPSKE